MKSTKIKQVQGQGTLTNFFRPKNDVKTSPPQAKQEDTSSTITKAVTQIKEEEQEQKLIESNSESISHQILSKQHKQSHSEDSNQTNPTVEQKEKEEYIRKKLSPYKYSKRKSFKSKSKSKEQKHIGKSPLNHKRSKGQLKWLRQTPSSKKKIKTEECDDNQTSDKVASIYKESRITGITLHPPEDFLKQNQQIPEEVETFEFEERNESYSNRSRISEVSRNSKPENLANRQLSINDFRQFSSTLQSPNKNQVSSSEFDCIRIQESRKIRNENKKNSSKQGQLNKNEKISKTISTQTIQTVELEDEEQNNSRLMIDENQIIFNQQDQQNLMQEEERSIVTKPVELEQNQELKITESEQQPQILNEKIVEKKTKIKNMGNLLSFYRKEVKNNQIDKQSENNDNNDNSKNKQIILSYDLKEKQSKKQGKTEVLNEPENEQACEGQQVISENGDKNLVSSEELQQDEQAKSIDAQTKANEKNAVNMLKIFIAHLESSKDALSEKQKQSVNKLKKMKPSTKQMYETEIKAQDLVTQYDDFISQFESVQDFKCKFCDYVEFMKITKKKKNEIYKQVNQLYKQSQSNLESFQKSLEQNVDQYYSRYIKNCQRMDNENNESKKALDNQEDKQEESRKMEIEMKDKESYSLIQYTTQWDQQIEIRPTDEQLEVVVSDIKKDTKIIACAGSGKTTTLVLRLKYLLDHGVKPNSIIISTFNIEAGKHISQKVYEMIGKEVQSSIIIGNIDKIAYRFIKGELEAKQKNSSSVLLFSQREYCDIWLAHIKKYKFQYMQYKYFFFDEFQDVSELQYEILMEFKKLNCVLTVIGDDAQNIYGFRDTKIDIIQNRIDDDLKKRKKDLQVFKLTANYRSTHAITMFANKIIEKNENLIKKTMESAQERHGESEENKMRNIYEKEGDYPYLHIFDSEKQQNEIIIKRILSMIRNQTCQFKDIAIIGPMNEQLKKFEESIEKHNQKSIQSDQIPYQAFITLKFEDFKLIDYNAAPQKLNRLTISTIHRSKGLEWDVVFFLGCNDDQFPMAFVQKNKNQACSILEEQRRLFYVGATRAIKELNFCCITKEPEKQTEKEKMLGKYKVSRFFADIPRENFRADLILDFQTQMITDYQWIEFEEMQKEGEEGTNDLKIREVISQMSSKQLEDINLYTQNIIADKNVKSLYMEKHEISQTVKDNQLFSEMGMFFDRCIVRMIGEKYEARNSFYNQVAAQVILPQIYELHLPENLFKLFLRYSKFFTTFDSAQLEDQKNVIERFQKEGEREKTNEEISDMKELHTILSYNAEIQCLKRIQMFHFQKHRPNRYFQDQFERLGQSYIIALSEYMNRSKKSETIFENIYKISKCGFLYERRRKYLYNNNLEQILDFDLLRNIQVNFINGFLSQFEVLECKRIYKTKYVSGLIDIIADNNHLIFFKFDMFDSYKKEDFLNYLFAAAFLRIVDSINIQQISIFNFLTGSVQSLDLNGWNQQSEFFDEVESISKAQILENLERNIKKIIDQQEEQILNREQKDNLKRALFQNDSSVQLEQGPLSIKLNTLNNPKTNPNLRNQLEGHVSETNCNQSSNAIFKDDHNFVEEMVQEMSLEGNFEENINQGERQTVTNCEQEVQPNRLSRKIKFEEEEKSGHPVVLLSETKISANNKSPFCLQIEKELNETSQNFQNVNQKQLINSENSDRYDLLNQQMQIKEEEQEETEVSYFAHEQQQHSSRNQSEKILKFPQNNKQSLTISSSPDGVDTFGAPISNNIESSSRPNPIFQHSNSISLFQSHLDLQKTDIGAAYLELYQKYMALKQEYQQTKLTQEIIKNNAKNKPKHKIFNNSKISEKENVPKKSLPDQIQERKLKFYKESLSKTSQLDSQSLALQSNASQYTNNNPSQFEVQVVDDNNRMQSYLDEIEEDDISNVVSQEGDADEKLSDQPEESYYHLKHKKLQTNGRNSREGGDQVKFYQKQFSKFSSSNNSTNIGCSSNASSLIRTQHSTNNPLIKDLNSHQLINAPHTIANNQLPFTNEKYFSQEEEDIQSEKEEEDGDDSFVAQYKLANQKYNFI